jgi:hypothetical protein
MQLRLVQDDPAAGSAPTTLEGRAQLFTEHRSGLRVAQRWTRLRVQDAVDHLSDEVRRHAADSA